MTLWIIFAGLTAVVLIALSWPLWRAGGRSTVRAAHDSAVYRDQLKEIDADLDRGLIGEREAEAAKLEISRRLLAVADGGSDERQAVVGRRSLSAVAVGSALFCVPALSLALYLAYGSPNLSGQPHAARLAKPAEHDGIAALVAKVEARLRANPSDGMGWDVIAPVYLKMRRFQQAADAYGRAIALLGESTGRLEGYAEALIFDNNGIVSETARKAYEKALAQDSELLKARYWLATAKEQDGRFAEAAEAWREMLKHGSEGARWRAVVTEHLRIAEARARGETVAEASAPETKSDGDAQPGPTAEQVAAADQMTAAGRAAMINQMVEGLAARLEDDGKDLKGWLRLVRAYTVLGKREAAETALADARRNFGDDAPALTQLNELAKSLGL